MQQLSTGFKRILIYTLTIMLLSVAYFIYAKSLYPPTPESETFLSELGEGFGEIALWLLLFVYLRTAMKLLLGKGSIAKRLIPEYSAPVNGAPFKMVLRFLNRTHIYFGIAAIAVMVLHIALLGVPMQILFFPAVIALIIWQGLFGLFISWRYSPKQIKKFSYLVHAQFITGIMLGVFSYFGHLLIDD